MPNNRNLNNAKSAKSDEFYTALEDIEQEMSAYLGRNPDLFRGKAILCPCDDPTWSNFAKHFAQNFDRYGLRKLVCTGYHKDGHGKKLVMESPAEAGNIVEMEGDGDFRSREFRSLLTETDFVITNPPFSLFREFIPWVGEKKFSVIGNINAITYKEVFPLIKENRIWVGATNFNRGVYFRVPDDYEYTETYKFDRERNGQKVMRVSNTCWFTNIEHDARHKTPEMLPMKELEARGRKFPKYEDLDAIEVAPSDKLPSDYTGVMGVPVTWLDKYNPELFEIVGYVNSPKMKIGGNSLYKRLLIRRRGSGSDEKAINFSFGVKRRTSLDDFVQ